MIYFELVFLKTHSLDFSFRQEGLYFWKKVKG